MKLTDGVISTGNKMGEGWLLTAEMIELVRAGYENIVCAQPFGCLPNHICGKGMINKIRELYPQANITPIDYDPSATRVNQENRIKLMLAVARERLAERLPTRVPGRLRRPQRPHRARRSLRQSPYKQSHNWKCRRGRPERVCRAAVFWPCSQHLCLEARSPFR